MTPNNFHNVYFDPFNNMDCENNDENVFDINNLNIKYYSPDEAITSLKNVKTNKF